MSMEPPDGQGVVGQGVVQAEMPQGGGLSP